ncbi:hypothetical protein SAMN04324257_02931 [Thermoanaerobacter thermohydrosulfuricus]|uniref:Uncharacterized protein n=1 Tax=Caldanaerobacter subterraneus subsp. pacificus DSM 12653 TaxID=391606 RepID=B7R6G2_9THEO|nr:hypothetical protein [Caldanaerobacter subterraneus]KKC28828.1 hypothetical protein CDSM653_02214 [Caldanaerobacter subterraneus subsp. pacificus DSM 12653]SFE82921.1 hypothetical protein SAMN04324257_02931 [Thermoanaerobacter thermohydrosulfuricus]
MIELHVWVYFLTLASYIIAGFVKGWNTAYLTAGAVVFGLPIVLIVVSIIYDKFEEADVKEKAEELLKNLKIDIEKVYEPESWYRVYHCVLISEKINTKCAVTCYKDSDEVHSVRLSPEWIRANKSTYQKCGWVIKEIIAKALKEAKK